ncbi:hypothetical protein DSO57_1009118 [Entomophthora muscae]|uniref:Uncharacterized protein n=1 Tax=Entomophthora muscae TaxID=34485 RepID=A0ACC2RY13_9FUNG|nr:hypothetical protein DSO57_1009118 [Entomophthora muscae]
MKLTCSFAALSFLATPVFCRNVFLRTSEDLGTKIDSFDALKSFTLSANKNACPKALYAFISVNLEMKSLESYFKENSDKLQSVSENDAKTLKEFFSQLASNCGGSVQTLKSDTVIQEDEKTAETPLFYQADASADDKLLAHLQEIVKTNSHFVFLIENAYASKPQTNDNTASGSVSSDESEDILHADPFFWWLSNGLIASLLVSLLLISILVVGISWLASVEGPTGFMDVQSKKQN